MDKEILKQEEVRIWNEMEPALIVKRLDAMQKSKAYLIIRDVLTKATIKSITDGPELKQLFQDIKAEATKSWQYDHKTATIADVDRATSNMYMVVLKLFAAQKNDSDTTFTQMALAINTIEEKLGLPKTNFNGGGENGNGDVQSVTPDTQ